MARSGSVLQGRMTARNPQKAADLQAWDDCAIEGPLRADWPYDGVLAGLSQACACETDQRSYFQPAVNGYARARSQPASNHAYNGTGASGGAGAQRLWRRSRLIAPNQQEVP